MGRSEFQLMWQIIELKALFCWSGVLLFLKLTECRVDVFGCFSGRVRVCDVEFASR
jgi:hypothetical protein